MSDDYLEYWVEQQEEEQQFLKLANHDPYRKSLGCWVDGIENEIWSWYPGHRVFGWMSRLHKELKIGSQSFLARNIYPADEREAFQSPNSKPLQIINGIVYEVTGSEPDAQFDVIVLSLNDLSDIKREAEKLGNTAKDLKEEYFVEMICEIATFIEEESSIKTFVIYREI